MPQELLEAKKLELIQEKVRNLLKFGKVTCSYAKCDSRLKQKRQQKSRADVERKNDKEKEKSTTSGKESETSVVEEEVEVAVVGATMTGVGHQNHLDPHTVEETTVTIAAGPSRVMTDMYQKTGGADMTDKLVYLLVILDHLLALHHEDDNLDR